MQRNIWNPVEYVRWKYFEKITKRALLCSKYTYDKDFAVEKIYRMSIFV